MKINENNVVVIDDVYRVYRKSYNGREAYTFMFWSFMGFNHGLITLTIPLETPGADEVCNEMGSKYQRRPLEIVFTSDDYNNCEVVSVKLVDAEIRDAKGEHFLYKLSQKKGFNGKEEDDETIEKRIEKETETKKENAVKKKTVVKKENNVKEETKMNNANNNIQVIVGRLISLTPAWSEQYCMQLWFEENKTTNMILDNNLNPCRIFIQPETAGRDKLLEEYYHGCLVAVRGEAYQTNDFRYGITPSYVCVVTEEVDDPFQHIIPPVMPESKKRTPEMRMPKTRQPRKMIR